MIRHRRRKISSAVSTFLATSVFLCALLKTREFLESLQETIPYDENGCNCPRFAPPIRENQNASLCSDYSTARGGNQRVIAYAIYGNHNDEKVLRQYYSQIEDRIKEAKFYYDGWIVRLYHNASREDTFTNNLICKLYCQYPSFDPCQVNGIMIPDTWFKEANFTPFSESTKIIKTKTLQQFGSNLHQSVFNFLSTFLDPLANEKADRLNEIDESTQQEGKENHRNETTTKIPFSKILIGKLWRFLPLGDELVSIFVVRDVDSFLLPREVAAVSQWVENSTALVHGMRDHPSHNGVILAGLWGAARWKDSKKMTGFLKEMLRYPPRDIWDYDQILLRRIVWPNVFDQILIHDSYHCLTPILKAKHRALPFPTKRRGKIFVSWGPYRSPTELKGIIPCPRECRPRDHQDWELC